MNSYKDKRKSDKDLEGEEKSNPHNGKNNLHLDKEEKESIPKSKSSLTSAEFIALKERGLRVLDEKIKKGLTNPDIAWLKIVKKTIVTIKIAVPAVISATNSFEIH